MAQIVVNLSGRDRVKAVSDLLRNPQRFLEPLTAQAEKTAQDGFSAAAYDGNNDVAVSHEVDGNHAVVAAEGQSVAFIEYGSGIYFNGTESYPGERPPGIVGIGEYGQGKGKRRAWGFYDDEGNLIITHGNPPAAAMYKAAEEAKQTAGKIVKEVLTND